MTLYREDPDYFNKWLQQDSVNKFIYKSEKYDGFELNMSSTESWEKFDTIRHFIESQSDKIAFSNITLINRNSNSCHQKMYDLLLLMLIISKDLNRMRLHISFHMHEMLFFHLLSIINHKTVTCFILNDTKIKFNDVNTQKIIAFINKCTKIKTFHIEATKIKNGNNLLYYNALNNKDSISEIFISDNLMTSENDMDDIFNMTLNNKNLSILKILKTKWLYDFTPRDQREEISTKHDQRMIDWIIKSIETNSSSIYLFEMFGSFLFKGDNKFREYDLMKRIFESFKDNTTIKTLHMFSEDIYYLRYNIDKFTQFMIELFKDHVSVLEDIVFNIKRMIGRPQDMKTTTDKLLSAIQPYLDRNKHNNIKRERTLFETMLDEIDLSSCNNKKQRIN